MVRYIDADKQVGIGYLSDWYQSSIDDTKPPIWTDEHLEELANDFIVIPKDTPTADVVEVKHGKWLLKHIGVGHYWECSECEFKNAVMPRTNYCPNCGAKMDSERNDEDGNR